MIKQSSPIEKDPWMLAEDIPNCDLFFSHIWLSNFVNAIDQHTGRGYQKILCKYEGYHLWFYFGQQDSFEVGENIVNRIVKEPGYAVKINTEIIKEADKLRASCETIPQTGLQKLNNGQIWEIYETHDRIHSEYYSWCWIPVAADMFHNNLTNRLKEYLRSLGVSEEKMVKYFITLTQPTKKSLIAHEHEELLQIALASRRGENIGDALEQHRKKYYYTKHLWVGGEYTIADYQRQIDDILKPKEPVEAIIEKSAREFETNKLRRDALMKELNISDLWWVIFDAFGDFMVTKIYRRYAQIFAVYQMTAVLKEIARRFCLTEKQARFMLPLEIKTMLLKNKYNAAELLERTKYCVYYAEKDTDIIYIGKKARDMMKFTEKNITYNDIKELRGDVACSGHAKGTVKIIIRAEDMAKMNQGDILVSIATDPDIVPAMKKAAAIVTEQGGVTSHAAIVSRELNIPCVIGTKIATKVFHDGQVVEVDAERGIVKKIK